MTSIRGEELEGETFYMVITDDDTNKSYSLGDAYYWLGDYGKEPGEEFTILEVSTRIIEWKGAKFSL